MDYLAETIRNAEKRRVRCEGDFIGTDGLLRCGVCGQKKERRIDIYGGKVVGMLCACGEAEEKRKEEEKRKRQADFRRSRCFPQEAYYGKTFAEDNGRQPKMSFARAYVHNWPENRKNNRGLLFCGGVGTGKSYAACAIANALCDKDIGVKFANFSQVLNDLQAAEDKNAYVKSLMNYALLIIDDFGMERSTEYAQEQLFNVIDSRVTAEKPLIVTTNLTLAELKNPGSLAMSRICDRVLKVCTPVVFEGDSFRKETAKANREALAEQFR